MLELKKAISTETNPEAKAPPEQGKGTLKPKKEEEEGKKVVKTNEEPNPVVARDEDGIALVFPIMKRNEMQRVVTGIVLKPEVVDAQEEIISAEEIEASAYDFMLEYRSGSDGSSVGYMHKELDRNLAVVESYLAPVDMKIGTKEVPKGAWVMSVKVLDDDIWQEVLDGKINGFSVGGYATKTRVAEPA